ncbi:MAG: thioredoxin fold domain-containing protein [Leptolyngbyaceae cyanobacterium SM1_1_3]|nr:thioredoxin fold domain-containing protein [Leptolyngbyaceae cyanobacterium SM1_1_3]NJN01692.1 thioredoxin fold domain-containing protein [Leptolyngbyaceae cyanobacterium RM1_1_2]NJO11317.1 thioredoxin fold domain-containing protein [Leptolyngbyaceae cyanobacterium SL_1_1]
MAADSSDSAKQAQASATLGQQLRNLVVVFVATLLTVAVVLGLQTQTPSASLGEMAEATVPLETALTNQKPTFMEFYANWCTSCQAMAADLQTLKTEYGDRVNFVMLNVDNSKWLPEMLHYRVDGIPHFVYLDGAGESIGSAIGEQPRLIMAENLDALLASQPLPHARSAGRTSELEAASPLSTSPGQDDPRSHGAQVVN